MAFKIAIINSNEARVYINGRVVLLWSGHGQIELLVLEYLKPLDVGHNFPLGAGVKPSMGDTEPIYAIGGPILDRVG